MEMTTLVEACRILNTNYKTAFYHMQLGRIPATRVGGVWLVKLDEVRTALDNLATPKARTIR